MPNTFSYIALIIWPFISILFYKRLPVINATFWTIAGGYLLLPSRVSIDFPVVPPLNKGSIASIAALIGCIYIKKIKINFLPKTGVERWLVLIFLIAPFFTFLNNQESINYIRGLTLYDSIADMVSQYFVVLPFILGLQLIKTHEDQLNLFKLLVFAGALYSVPILFEIRMSPQLHTWVYGFFPHSFVQQARDGGFRAVVFLGHGLLVALFVAVALGSAAILVKCKIKSFGLSPWVFIALFIILLVLNKTLGALILGVFVFTIIVWAPPNIIKKASLLIVTIVILYPILLIFDLIPYEKLVLWATDINPVRGDSLAFRFHHESLLLEHAYKKLFFGWGGWGRNRLEGSVSDGYWIITLGVHGLFGFISLFGLLFLSVWKAGKSSSLLEDKVLITLLVSHALIISIIMIDQIPNASLTGLYIFISGSLLGRANYIKKAKM